MGNTFPLLNVTTCHCSFLFPLGASVVLGNAPCGLFFRSPANWPIWTSKFLIAVAWLCNIVSFLRLACCCWFPPHPKLEWFLQLEIVCLTIGIILHITHRLWVVGAHVIQVCLATLHTAHCCHLVQCIHRGGRTSYSTWLFRAIVFSRDVIVAIYVARLVAALVSIILACIVLLFVEQDPYPSSTHCIFRNSVKNILSLRVGSVH